MEALELLLVHGDASLRRLLATFLELHGFLVRPLGTLDGAERVLTSGYRPAAIVLDEPDLGCASAARLRGVVADLPIVVLSFQPRAAAHTANVVVPKPFLAAQLIAAIELVVAARRRAASTRR